MTQLMGRAVYARLYIPMGMCTWAAQCDVNESLKTGFGLGGPKQTQ